MKISDSVNIGSTRINLCVFKLTNDPGRPYANLELSGFHPFKLSLLLPVATFNWVADDVFVDGGAKAETAGIARAVKMS